MVKKQILLLVGCFVLLFTHLQSTNKDGNDPTPALDEVSGCLIVGEPRPFCDWRSDVYTVLNACYTQDPGANCQWWQGSGIYLNGPASIISGDGNWSAEVMNSNVQIVATNAQNNPPSDGYRLYSYSVTTIMNPNGSCQLQITPVFRKVACEAPPSNG